MIQSYRCDHPATDENSVINGGGIACRLCRSEINAASYRRRRAADATGYYLNHRKRYLPEQLEVARRKVAALENEARRYGMTDLLEVAR